MFRLRKSGYDKELIVSYGNMFLLGNGHIGYRGTLEEYEKSESVAVNIVGAYDRYHDSWREPVNAPNPFYVSFTFDGVTYDARKLVPLSHQQVLDTKHGIFSRETEYGNAIIRSSRYIDKLHVANMAMKYEIEALSDGKIVLETGIDYDVWNTNGPHLFEPRLHMDGIFTYLGVTNEGKYCAVSTAVSTNFPEHPIIVSHDGKMLKKYVIKAIKGQIYKLVVFADIRFGTTPLVLEESTSGLFTYKAPGYAHRLLAHRKEWERLWAVADVKLEGDLAAQFALRYSIYHLLILAPTVYTTSIPARGLSGQTYKGAIFWDTEIFMLPFFNLTSPEVARRLVDYRLNTLDGAKRKAKMFGYDGAFYAWESQETGDEACSLYNVSDALTGKPIRTYFADKQIHISGDVALGIVNTYERSHDMDILLSGGLEALLEIAKFFKSYATYDETKQLYFINDVIGPDEYHERIDNNAFTNYLAAQSVKYALHYASLVEEIHPDAYQRILKQVGLQSLTDLAYFLAHLFLPVPNEDGIIEQFTGYFQKEDVLVPEVRSRLKSKNEYWGGTAGVATPTRVIKQADVVTLLVLFPDLFSGEIKKKNFKFYEKYTEHGSSLSACMYSLLACEIKKPEWAYPFFLRSANIDLGKEAKQYAGSIYIGGTHPASNGGTYMAAVYGFAGLRFTDKGIKFQPSLPKEIKSLSFRYYENDVLKEVKIDTQDVVVKKVKL